MAITNLTNTKWSINSTTCTAGYGQFDIDFDAIVRGSVELFGLWQLGIGYSSTKQGQVATANTIALGSSLEDASVGDTITITSGQDVTNSNLISWLTANATQLPVTTSIIVGENTLTGVDTIKVADTNNPSTYLDFVYNNTPTTTTSIKIGGNTLTGVNQINMLGTDSTYKSFGYVAPVSGFNVTLDGTGHYTEDSTQLFGYAKFNSSPTAWNDFDVQWGCGYVGLGAGTGVTTDNWATYSLTKSFTGVNKIYCWAGESDGSATGTTNKVKINNVDISSNLYNNAYELNVTQDSTFMVQGADEE